jgi:hypothetical protein
MLTLFRRYWSIYRFRPSARRRRSGVASHRFHPDRICRLLHSTSTGRNGSDFPRRGIVLGLLDAVL